MKKVIKLASALLIAGVLAACSETENETKDDAEAKEVEVEQPSEVAIEGKNLLPKVGEELIIDEVGFTIEDFRYMDSYGDEEQMQPKKGNKLLVLDVEVKNKGSETIMPDSTFFQAVDHQDRLYNSMEDGVLLFGEIEPDTAKTGVVIYDVPETREGKLAILVQAGLSGTYKAIIELVK